MYFCGFTTEKYLHSTEIWKVILRTLKKNAFALQGNDA